MTIENPAPTPDAAPTAADRHHAARVEHAKAEANTAAAATVLADAQAARDALLARAGDGHAVGASDIRAAENEIREAEAAALLARAVETGAQRRMFAAEVPALRDTAANIEAAVATAAADFLAISESIDAELAALKEKMAIRDEANRLLGQALQRALDHNREVANRASINSVIGAQHASIWPKTRLPAQPFPPLPPTSIDLTERKVTVAGILQVAISSTLGGIARSVYGALLPRDPVEKAA